jgi:hypothetical protein
VPGTWTAWPCVQLRGERGCTQRAGPDPAGRPARRHPDICVPADPPRWTQTERNRIRLKNLLRYARHALRAEGTGTGQIDAILEPAHQFLDLKTAWDQPTDGLALCLGPDGSRHLRVPLPLPELVTVGDGFVVRPLLRLLVRALQGTGRTSREPTEALAAAQQGRVETLFLSTDAPEWCTRTSGRPLIRLGDIPGAAEQLDLAAVATLRHAGAVYAVPASGGPETSPVAAILRY